MNDFQRWKSHMVEICDRAANGTISIEEFYERWPKELRNSDLAQSIYEDLEEGIQHFPAKLLSGKPDYDSWKSSKMYRRIVIDCDVLKNDLSEENLAELRSSLLAGTGKY